MWLWANCKRSLNKSHEPNGRIEKDAENLCKQLHIFPHGGQPALVSCTPAVTVQMYMENSPDTTTTPVELIIHLFYI